MIQWERFIEYLSKFDRERCFHILFKIFQLLKFICKYVTIFSTI